ncbi:unnamed protein product [Ixodes pacificus]
MPTCSQKSTSAGCASRRFSSLKKTIQRRRHARTHTHPQTRTMETSVHAADPTKRTTNPTTHSHQLETYTARKQVCVLFVFHRAAEATSSSHPINRGETSQVVAGPFFVYFFLRTALIFTLARQRSE